MKVTKREHATMLVEQDGATLVIDPGSFTEPFEVDELCAIVITHQHADHWDEAHLKALTEAHPDVPIYGPDGVHRAVTDFEVTIVHTGDTVEAGPFTLRFFGGTHAQIHRSIPFVDNLGVLVNGRFYYGGDSYAEPDVPVELLAVPAGAPWLKIGDVMDYVLAVSPRRTFSVHEVPLSRVGLRMANARIEWAAGESGGTHTPLEPGESITLD